MKILITGGHLTPALAIIDEINKRNIKKNIEILFVGRKYSLDSEKTLSLEYREVTSRGIKFIPLQAGRLTRIFSLRSLRSIVRIPLGFFNGLKIVFKEKPNIVFSFGGYLALPVVFWAWVLNIPVYTHEQTISPGLANKIIAFFAKKVFVAFEDSLKNFNKKKVVLTGNPVRKAIFISNKNNFKINTDKPIIYITGGSLGSYSINTHIAIILGRLLKKYFVIHQTGSTKEYQNLEMMKKALKKLPLAYQKNYLVREHFYENEIGYIYSKADIVIARAGANTFFELLALKKPAIFIPLPWSANGEQEKHARIFKDNGVGEIFHQNQSSNQLLLLIDHMLKNLNSYKNNFAKLNHLYKQNASQYIVSTFLPKI